MQHKSEWKSKFQEIVQACQGELKKTTEIGKKMLSASKTTSSLNESYEELGRIAARALDEGSLKWDNSRATDLLEAIKNYNKDLEEIEGQVNDIRFEADSQSKNSKNEDTQSPEKKPPS